jgi:hypothetical protein
MFNFEGVDELVMEALTINYRVSPIEVDMLQIYDNDFGRKVIDVVRGMPLLLELTKKKARSGGDSLPPADESISESPPVSPPSSGMPTETASTSIQT